MNEAYAQQRGAQGESRVREAIIAENALGYWSLHDLLLVTSRDKSTQIDHAVIDRFGILIVETKNVGGLLRGKSGEKNWTICYPGGKKHTMISPIEQNELHRKRLHQFLLAQGMQLRENYVQSLIVFADGNIDALELTAEDSMRVTTVDGLRGFLRARYDFQPNEGILTDLLVEDYANQLAALNRANDPEAMARHIAQAQAAKIGRRGKSERRGNYPARLRTTSASHRPAPRETLGQAFASEAHRLTLNIIGVAAAILAFFVFMSVGVPLFTRALDASLGTIQAPAVFSAPSPIVSADPTLALQRLREADPEMAAALTDPQHPRVSSERGLTVYTWDYLKKTSKGSVDVSTFSIALGPDGTIVGSP